MAEDIKAAIRKVLGESTQKLTGAEETDKNTAAAKTIKTHSGVDNGPEKIDDKGTQALKKSELTNPTSASDSVAAGKSGDGVVVGQDRSASGGSKDFDAVEAQPKKVATQVAAESVEGEDYENMSDAELEAQLAALDAELGSDETVEEGKELAASKEEAEEIEALEKRAREELGARIVESAEATTAKAKDGIKAVVESCADLSADNKVKIATLFETTLSEAVEAFKTVAIEQYDKIFESAVQKHYEVLSEQVDTYLTYVAEEWVKENKLAVYHGVRQQIAESFIEDLRGVFEKHDLQIPDSKVDLLERAVARIEELEGQVAQKVEEAAKAAKEKTVSEKTAVVESFVSGMVKTQAEKVREFAKEIEFKDSDSFKAKLNVIVEHHFPVAKAPKKAEALLEDISGEKNDKVLVEEVDSAVADVAGRLVR